MFNQGQVVNVSGDEGTIFDPGCTIYNHVEPVQVVGVRMKNGLRLYVRVADILPFP